MNFLMSQARPLKSLISFLLLMVAWEFGGNIFNIPPRHLIPTPWMISAALWELREDFILAFYETTLRTLAGFTLSLVAGLCLAFGAHLFQFLRNLLLPLSLFFQTVPIIAIAPLLVIYFGFGAPTVIASSTIVSLFPIIANTLIGLEQTPIAYLDLFKLSHASPWQILFRLRWPYAYPQIIAGIKISAGLAVIGTIAGEFVGGGGLGAMIDSARTQQRIDVVFGCLILLSVLGIGLLSLLNGINKMILKWRPLALPLKIF